MNGKAGKQYAERAARCRPWLIGVLSASVIAGCGWSAPDVRYRTLSFFFDGVPVPETMPAAGDTQQEAGSARTTRVRIVAPTFSHQPYKEGNCETCHSSAGTGAQMAPSAKVLCSKCHTDFNKGARYWHGPAAAWACLQCHSPHESHNEALLVKPVGTLCAACHDTESKAFLASNDAHTDKENCTRCHDPHGSSDRMLLKP